MTMTMFFPTKTSCCSCNLALLYTRLLNIRCCGVASEPVRVFHQHPVVSSQCRAALSLQPLCRLAVALSAGGVQAGATDCGGSSGCAAGAVGFRAGADGAVNHSIVCTSTCCARHQVVLAIKYNPTTNYIQAVMAQSVITT